MKVKELMKKEIFSLRPSQNLHDAAQLMWEHDCGWAPVIDQEGKVRAAITDRDIAMAAFLNGARLSEIPLEKAQSRMAVSCNSTDDIATVEKIMQSSQLRRLPVIDKDKKVVGIIALNDIALAYSAGKNGIDAEGLSKTLAAICNHGQSAQPMAAVA